MKQKYILKQGIEDKKRLAALSDVYDKGSKLFINNSLKEKPIKKILDIGCGQGSISRFLAEKYPKAQIIGVDISQEQLEIFQSENQKYENIQSIAVDITNESFDQETWDLLKSADLIYVRYLLLHLKEWEVFFDNIYKLLNKDGQVIIEEPGFPWITYPDSEILQKATAVSQEFLHSLNYKFDCIPHLWEFLKKQNKFQIQNVEFNHPILKSYKQKSLMWMSFIQIKEPLLKANVYTDEEFAVVLKELQHIAENSEYIGISLRVIQVHLVK